MAAVSQVCLDRSPSYEEVMRAESLFPAGRRGEFKTEFDAWNGYGVCTLFEDGEVFFSGLVNRCISLIATNETSLIKTISLRSFSDGRIFLLWGPDIHIKEDRERFNQIQQQRGFTCDGISALEEGPNALADLQFLAAYNAIPPDQYARFEAILRRIEPLQPVPENPLERAFVEKHYLRV